MNQDKHIIDIKNAIEKRQMSFIVGAGFSRNISDHFPMWSDLLKPMAEELYGAGQYSDKTYLDIASEYVRRKGYHEAIDLYVEQHMPYLRKSQEGVYELYRNGVRIEENPDLTCHQALLAMGVKDIYTFNYDNALEMVGGVDKSDELRRKLQEDTICRNKLQERQKKYQEHYEAFCRIGTQTAASLSGDETMQTQNSFRQSDNPYAKINDYVRSLGEGFKLFDENYNNEAHDHNLLEFEKQVNLLNNNINNYERDLRKHYQLICQSYEISITENRKNIYKLHGNLRKPDTKDCFGFDGDGHKQYIITREDYDDYPHKHEAFVNLMKIALLKGSFCLVGFSGDDPNFLAWISWIKDVLDKNPDKGKRATIYFIHVGGNNISPDKLQLFKNHYITPVILKDVYAIKQEKEQMKRFLKDISPEEDLTKQYDDLWNVLRFRDNSDFSDKQKGAIDELYIVSEKIRIPSQGAFISNIHSWAVSTVYKQLKSNNSSPYLPKLAYLTAKCELRLLPQIYTNDALESLMAMIPPQEASSLRNNYELHKVRYLLLRGHNHQSIIEESTLNKGVVYDAVWAMLFHLDFSKAWNQLEEWKGNSTFDKLRREFLRALYQELDETNMTNLLNREKYACLQDYIFATEVLPLISGLWHKNQNLFHTLRENDKDFPTIQKTYKDVLNDLTNELLEPENVTSFGTRQRVYGVDAHSGKWEKSAQILYLMIELSLLPHVSSVTFFDKKKWIIVCEQLMEDCPYPCLFFSLLYGNDKTLIKKVAQMFIYTSKLRSLIPQMLEEMLNALFDERCPEDIKKAIYLAAPIFAKAVPADKWQDTFFKLFERYDWEHYNSEYDLCNQSSFMKAMMTRVKDVNIKTNVIVQCLQQTEKVDHFCNEMIIAAREGISANNRNLKKLLVALLDIADQSAHFYVLLNMYMFLPKAKLTQKLLERFDIVAKEHSLLYAVAYHSKKIPELQTKIKRELIENSDLWATGIHADGSGVSVLNDDLDVNRIQMYVHFTKDDILTLYDKMLASIEQLESYYPKWKKHSYYNLLFNDWNDLINIMARFLKRNEVILSENRTNYPEILTRIANIKIQYKPNSILENLLNDEYTVEAIADLVNVLEEVSPRYYLNEYAIITNKIILQDSKALNSCFKHLSWVMTKYKRYFPKRQFAPLLSAMFASYEPYFCKENAKPWNLTSAEKDVAEASLIKLAKIYESWGNSCYFGVNYLPWYSD